MRSRSTQQLSVFTLGLALYLCTSPIAAHAEPITVVVTSGFAETDLNLGGPLSISGTEGFFLEGSLKIGSVQPADRFTPLAPGSVVPVGGLWNASDVPGTLGLSGHTFASYTLGVTPGFASLRFVADPVTLPSLSSMAVLRTPFTLSGSLTTPPVAGPGTNLQATLIGHGIATLTLQQSVADGTWLGRSLRFEFQEAAPVPEPATMLLIGTGLAAMYRASRRSSKSL